ncbi:MAG: glycosyltransferase [Deltaproteobacteria bacterium]|nr:glycosyltransferase [Deltaproteobacteria bacterium]
MLEGRDIVCVASANWDALWVNAQHLMHRLAARNRILYINNPGLRPPGASKSDFAKIVARLRGWFAGAREVEPNVFVLSPVTIPLHRFAFVRALNRILLRRRVKRWAAKLGMTRPILWTFLPTGIELVKQLGESAVIYQCVDDYAANPGVDVASLTDAERRLESLADLVIVTRPALAEAKRARAANVFYSPNCADVAHFETASAELPLGARDQFAGRKVIGYHGNLSGYKTDLPLLARVADAFPDAVLALVGPEGWGDPSTDLGELRVKPNVVFAGRQDRANLPAFVRAFDVGLLPLADNASTRASFPMKFYEYMACGKPIVATDLPSFAAYRDRPDLCRLAATPEAFVEEVRAALADPGDASVVAARIAEARAHDWPARVESIGVAVMNALAKPRTRVALVHDWLTGMRGGEKVLESLCELWPDADLFTLLYLPGKLSPVIERRRIFTSFVQKLPRAATAYRNYLPLFPYAIEQFDFRNYDLVISTSHCVAKGVITGPDTCHVSYLHTPMRYVWDQYDQYFGPARVKSRLKRAAIAFFAHHLRTWDAASASRVDAYTCNSAHVARRIRKFYGRDATVIHPPVDLGRFALGGASGDYYLIVSAFAPYKRLDLALEAARIGGFALKVAGSGEDLERLRASAPANVEFLGWCTDDEIAELYRGCRAFLFPGEEDFGITPLEAQACGKPVIAYAKGGALETVRGALTGEAVPPGATGVFFGEQTAESLLAAIRWFEANAGRFDPAAIRAHAEPFAREEFARKIRAFVDERFAAFGHERMGV